MEERGGRRYLIFKYLPLTPTLSPFGGERESDANCIATLNFLHFKARQFVVKFECP
jgi:hypothetical protein